MAIGKAGPALTPVPVSGVGACSVRDVTGLFREASPGVYRADLPCPAPDACLRVSRAGARAVLTAQQDGRTAASRRHYSSYTDWDMPLRADPSRPLSVTLSLAGDEHTATPYEKCGIYGRILLIALPSCRLLDLAVSGDPDTGEARVHCPAEGGAPRTVTLFGPDGSPVAGAAVPSGEPGAALRVPSPRLWSPESPALYTARVELAPGGSVLARYEKRFGFARIQRDGDRLLLNGAPLRLMGAAYREPLPGEGLDPARDLALLREAGVGFLRGLYYPFSERFLDLCDECGMPVEQASPAYGVGTLLPESRSAPDAEEDMLDMWREMLARDRSHPCIALWGMGEMCAWGGVFRAGRALFSEWDTRPVDFHFPMSVPEGENGCDVWHVQHCHPSLPYGAAYDHFEIVHTPGADNAIGYAAAQDRENALPVLHGACAMPPAFDPDDRERDAGVCEAWGESLVRIRDAFLRAKGACGMAVFAAADEDGSFHPRLRDARWGVLDARHRPKSEYWHLKMALEGRKPRLAPSPPPERSAPLLRPASALRGAEWESGRISARIDPDTGLLSGVWDDGVRVIESGPYAVMGRYGLGPWRAEEKEAYADGDALFLRVSGSYGESARVLFEVGIEKSGVLRARCEIASLSFPMPHRVKAGYALDPGGLTEFGIGFLLPAQAGSFSWSRRALWDEYPDGHIGRPRGAARREDGEDYTSQKAHVISARIDVPGSCVRVLPEGDQSVRLSPAADPRCVMDVLRPSCPAGEMRFEGNWIPFFDPAGGPYAREGLTPDTHPGAEAMARAAGDACAIRFTGTGIAVFDTTDVIRGKCDLFLDGRPYARGVSRYVSPSHAPTMGRGYEKRFRQSLAGICGLPFGGHELRIALRGDREPQAQDTAVSLSGSEVLRPDMPPRVYLRVNSRINYPRLGYGNFVQPPVLAGAGDSAGCTLLFGEEESGA